MRDECPMGFSNSSPGHVNPATGKTYCTYPGCEQAEALAKAGRRIQVLAIVSWLLTGLVVVWSVHQQMEIGQKDTDNFLLRGQLMVLTNAVSQNKILMQYEEHLLQSAERRAARQGLLTNQNSARTTNAGARSVRPITEARRLAIWRTADFRTSVHVERLATGVVVQVSVCTNGQHWSTVSIPRGKWGEFTSTLRRATGDVVYQ